MFLVSVLYDVYFLLKTEKKNVFNGLKFLLFGILIYLVKKITGHPVKWLKYGIHYHKLFKNLEAALEFSD